MRKSKSISNKNIEILYNDIISSIIKSGGIPIGITNTNIDEYINICNGYILQGGDDIDEDNIKIIKKLQSLNKPTLGICLGMQEMAYVNNGIIYDIDNHINKLHEIKIIPNTLLHKIIKKDKILVNSRHKSAIKNTNLLISSLSNDEVIESIEDNTKKFFLGVQWHPENIYDTDINSKNIFDYFINICNDK